MLQCRFWGSNRNVCLFLTCNVQKIKKLQTSQDSINSRTAKVYKVFLMVHKSFIMWHNFRNTTSNKSIMQFQRELVARLHNSFLNASTYIFSLSFCAFCILRLLFLVLLDFHFQLNNSLTYSPILLCITFAVHTVCLNSNGWMLQQRCRSTYMWSYLF